MRKGAQRGTISIMAGQELSSWDNIDALARAVRDAGRALGFPFVAAQSDLGDPQPMSDRNCEPYAATVFDWPGHSEAYWQDRRLALKSSFLHAARICAEPMWYHRGQIGSWRPTDLLDQIDCSKVTAQFGFTAAIIAPTHLPGGRIGAVVWVTREEVDLPTIFSRESERLFVLAFRFIAAHAEASAPLRAHSAVGQLTGREVQCVRWAAAGKTNTEIGMILSLSVSTVRFHLRNAGAKLGAASRSRTIQLATGHGFLGART